MQYIKIGNVQIKKTAALAPMAGVADRPMREICALQGASYLVGEMASAKGIALSSVKSKELLMPDDVIGGDGERIPFASQIFGNEPEVMAEAAVIAESYAPDIIDINMGCPAPKIVNGGAGSALMKTPKLAAEIADRVVKSVKVPVTAKIRLGWDVESKNATELAKMLADVGVSAITVHGRTRSQMYTPPIDPEGIASVVRAVSIPVIGNGDIVTAADAVNMYSLGCSLVMVGRGALGRPWMFRDIADYLIDGTDAAEPSLSERRRVFLQHMELLFKYKGDGVAMREARKHAAWYMREIHGAAELRRKCSEIATMEDIVTLADRAFSEL